MNELLEKDIQAAILEWLQYRSYKAWRNNSGLFKHDYTTKFGVDKTSMIRAGAKGQSDIFAIQPKTGKFVAIEVKRPGKQATDLQQQFLDEVNAKGGIGFVARSLDDVIKKL